MRFHYAPPTTPNDLPWFYFDQRIAFKVLLPIQKTREIVSRRIAKRIAGRYSTDTGLNINWTNIENRLKIRSDFERAIPNETTSLKQEIGPPIHSRSSLCCFWQFPLDFLSKNSGESTWRKTRWLLAQSLMARLDKDYHRLYISASCIQHEGWNFISNGNSPILSQKNLTLWQSTEVTATFATFPFLQDDTLHK